MKLFIKYIIFGILLVLFNVYSCSSTNGYVPEKLDLSSETQIIKDSKDISEPKKRFILNTFEKAENYCNDSIALINKLNSEISSLKSNLESEKELADRYRTWRMWVIISFIALLLWVSRGVWFPLLRKMILPV